MKSRRPFPLRRLPVLGLFALLAIAASPIRAAGEMFDFEVLRYRAKLLAAQPYVEPPARVPESLTKLSYDQHRFINFKPAESIWRRDQLPFELQFFHPGFIFNQTVQISELRGRNRRAEPIFFSRELFSYGDLRLDDLPESMGFSGFRILYSLNKPQDELGAFQGASYFRFLCQRAVYGLSARGLALNTGAPGGEEFPVFEEFWVERPRAEAKELTVYALLDSVSVAGAFRFVVAPGAETVMRVRTAFYFRNNPAVVGVAPLTSMFWHGENTTEPTGDFRPEVHDSDGLLLNSSSGEWLWRPLTNPKKISDQAFADENPRGFGLLQRDRAFASYEDLEANYHLRPSAWIEPVGNWGRGRVHLVELPSADETNDNIVAFWAPEQLPPPGEPLELEYKLHWFLDQIRPPAGFTAATRHGHSRTHEPDLERFVVEFDGPYLSKQGADPAIEPVITVGDGAALVHSTVQKNTFNGRWRVAFALRADGTGRAVSLRCFLRKNPHVLTETWSYLWQP